MYTIPKRHPYLKKVCLRLLVISTQLGNIADGFLIDLGCETPEMLPPVLLELSVPGDDDLFAL